MSCAKNISGEEYQNYIDFINNKKFYNSQSSNSLTNNCRRSFLPSFTPELYSLSTTSSNYGKYTKVYVSGSNFLPNGSTFIFFGSEYLPVTYYSSFNLSFIVPLRANTGNHNVKVVNLYNGNFSTPVNQSYSGNLNYSNSINYTIT
jgi:hypothetical protein